MKLSTFLSSTVFAAVLASNLISSALEAGVCRANHRIIARERAEERQCRSCRCNEQRNSHASYVIVEENKDVEQECNHHCRKQNNHLRQGMCFKWIVQK